MRKITRSNTASIEIARNQELLVQHNSIGRSTNAKIELAKAQTVEALKLAGLLADAALFLVGGDGINFSANPLPLGFTDKPAAELRLALEAYNAHILKMSTSDLDHNDKNREASVIK